MMDKEKQKYLIQLIDLFLGECKDDDVMEWYAEAKAVAKQYIYSEGLHGTKIESPIQQLFVLLRSCLLAHRWEDAAKVLKTMSKYPEGTSTALWRGGMEVYYHSSCQGKDDTIRQLVKHLKGLIDLSGKEVILEYVMFLLSQHNIEEAQRAMEDLPKEMRKTPTEHSRHVKSLWQGYQGLLVYISWLQAKQRLQRARDQDLPELIEEREEQMTLLATKAVRYFQQITNTHGVWDIFVTKHAELLEYHETEGATKLLEDYRERNMDNPNAHRYLYNNLKTRGASLEDRISCLEKLVHLVPSDDHVLEYHNLLEQQGSPLAERLYLLFDFVDYDCWRNHSEAWRTLADQLTGAFERNYEAEMRAVKECWEIRESWWPLYQFKTPQRRIDSATPLREDDSTMDWIGLQVSKTVVAVLLTGTGCGLYQYVKMLSLDSSQVDELSQAATLYKQYNSVMDVT
ncbi:unnamed protein product [Owenia fusiformis]|uniref:Uncharacterized protein n=1 Tax=Owenia fusiformis TaxID=6347 RepID=A0A8J1U127_OWEFU|nr:unnamed protein product [Owenia fusiformis]